MVLLLVDGDGMILFIQGPPGLFKREGFILPQLLELGRSFVFLTKEFFVASFNAVGYVLYSLRAELLQVAEFWQFV